jgi:hypothetical protein
MTNTEPQSEQAWRLLHGETLVGEVYVTDADFPWLSGRFVPQEEFENIRALFEEELALIDREGELDVEKWESIYRQIVNRVTLIKPDGTPAAEFLLHIKDNDAWLRRSDEPFHSENE